MKLFQLEQQVASRLAVDFPDTAAFEARFIIQHCVGLEPSQLIVKQQDSVSGQLINDVHVCVERRLLHEPLDYILGNSEFMGELYCIQPGVLIPRPETEILVQVARDHLSSLGIEGFIGVEYGFGSGVISIELAKQFPKSSWVAFDVSEQAYMCARVNAEKHQIDNVNWIHGPFSMQHAAIPIQTECCVCIANPPYITSQSMRTLDRSVKEFEPECALHGGDTGLDAYKDIIESSKGRVDVLYFEWGKGQAETITALADEHGFNCHLIEKDLQGIERVGVFTARS